MKHFNKKQNRSTQNERKKMCILMEFYINEGQSSEWFIQPKNNNIT